MFSIDIKHSNINRNPFLRTHIQTGGCTEKKIKENEWQVTGDKCWGMMKIMTVVWRFHKNHTNQRKGIQIGREKKKMSLYAGDTILYIGNPKDTTQKLIDLMNKFSKVAGNKINIQK